MSAAVVSYRTPLPLYQEGLAFWDNLQRECETHTQAINTAVSNYGLTEAHLVEWVPGRAIRMVRNAHPSTDIAAGMSFERWGPVIKVSITGQQHDEVRYYPQQLEVPIARDVDGKVVAVFAEGRSFSEKELASYLAQHMRRCFPEVALPCPLSD